MAKIHVNRSGRNSFEELLEGFDFDLIKSTSKIPRVCKHYKCRDTKQLVKKIFIRFLEEMIDDVIDNGSVFRFPTMRSAFVYVGPNLEDKIKYRMKYADNPFELGNIRYTIRFSIEKKRGSKHKLITIDHKRWSRLQDNINNGKNYIDNLLDAKEL